MVNDVGTVLIDGTRVNAETGWRIGVDFQFDSQVLVLVRCQATFEQKSCKPDHT